VKKLINRTIEFVAASLIGLVVYKLASAFKQLTLRFGSVAKQRALFPNARNLRLDVRTEIKYAENITFGRDVIVGADCCIGAMAPIVIGDLVRISRGVTLETGGLITRGELPYPHTAKSIHIGRGVWLGAGVTVLAGVTIGEMAIIGAGTVVAKDVQAGAIIVGPAYRMISADRRIEGK